MPELSLPLAIGLFIAAASVIAFIGTKLTGTADMLADRTGLGEAMAGAVLLGASTSAAGVVTSVTAASGGDIDLAYSNSLGGIAAQTAFLACADIAYRRANLEHAAAEASNLSQSTLLILLLAIPLIAGAAPPITFFGVHPASLVLVLVYVAGVKLSKLDREAPMWQPRDTTETRHDVPEEDNENASATRLVLAFSAMVVVVGIAGYVVAETGMTIARETGIAGSVVGALLTATVTSLPELVTTLAAIRRGALQLAVGGIIGGNTFDVLFLSASDVAYRDGSIYNAIGPDSRFWALVGIAMTAVLLLGLIRRERSGIGNVGFETAGILSIYLGAVAIAAFAF
ncbi:sodium:calcium antiporter [Afifella sp. IM 167]|uniref:sodium:calcium antiporter n=1 Tax=Afifella sp. IM 167 TaxID=2033586 RepID=UPI001CD0399E|nr:sodium:calcium antiporter [Afifella sp. IM 167]MBZ8135009.1 cation transporter [Afifella sp. IM 167]